MRLSFRSRLPLILALQHVNDDGEVPEWLIGHAWRACVLQKGTEGSNPSLSAKRAEPRRLHAAFRLCLIQRANGPQLRWLC